MTLFANAEAFAKDTFLPGYLNQFEHAKGTLYGLLGNQSKDIEGRRTQFKVRIGDSTGGGVIAQGGDFFQPGDVRTQDATVRAAHLSHTIGFDDEELGYLDSGAAAAAPIMKTKMDAAFEAMDRYIERQAWGDGTGVLASRAAAPGGAVMTLNATTTAQVDRDRFIWIDDSNRNDYMVVNPTTGAATMAGPLRIIAINEAANQVTFSAAVAGNNNDVIVPFSPAGWNDGAGSFRSLEFEGLQAMLAAGNTYLGINRTTNSWWVPTVLGNSGTLRNMTDALAFEFVNKIRRRRGDGKAPGRSEYLAFASPGTWVAYHNLMSPGLRYTLGEMPDIGWQQPINMLGVPLYSDIRTPRNGIMMLHKSSIQFVKAKHRSNVGGDLFKFLDRGAGIFFQANASTGQAHAAKVFAYLDGFLGMYTDRPRNHGWLQDITEIGSTY